METHLTTSEAAKLIGCDPSRVRQLLRDGKLEGERVGRDWLVLRASVEAFRKLPEPSMGWKRGEKRKTKSGRPAKRRKK